MKTQSHVTNPTSVITIPKQNVAISVTTDPVGRRQSFSLDHLSLDSFDLPDDAVVMIWAEAGYDSISFDFGTVSEITHPAETSVLELDPSRPLRFRLTVFRNSDPKLLATAEAISAGLASDPSNVLPILPVEILSLNDRIWEVSGIESERPILKVTDDPDIDAANRIANDAIFQALILPDAFRQAIEHVARNDPESSDPDDWANLWRRFIETIGGSYPPDVDLDSDIELREWSTELSDRFAKRLNLKNKLKISLGVMND